jgi:DNA ligase-associated metallophosphoesterase
MVIELEGEELTLCYEKALLFSKRKTLLISDLHFGKVNHFRKAGISVPQKATEKNVEMLIDLLNWTSVERVIFLGDLFHSHYNEDWEVLGQVLKHFSACAFELVRGNHDVLSNHQYLRHAIKVHEIETTIGSFVLSHEPMEQVPAGYYNLAGHLHPAIRLQGKARQSITLPCFCFGKRQGLLPAFGYFTGLYCITPQKEDKIFAIIKEKVQLMN